MINQLVLAMEELRPYYRRSENDFVNEDALQSAFLEALERVQGGYQIKNPRAFLKTIAYRKACDVAKSAYHSRAVSIHEEGLSLENIAAVPKRSRRAYAKRIGKSLKPAMKAIMELILEGYTYQEIDEMMGKKEGYSKLAIFRLRKSLEKDSVLKSIIMNMRDISDVSGEYSIYSSKAHEPDFEPDKEDMNPYIPVVQTVSDSISPWFISSRDERDIPRVKEANPREGSPMKKRMYRDNQGKVKFIGMPDMSMDHAREVNAVWPIR